MKEQVTNVEAIEMARRLALKEGLLVNNTRILVLEINCWSPCPLLYKTLTLFYKKQFIVVPFHFISTFHFTEKV